MVHFYAATWYTFTPPFTFHPKTHEFVHIETSTDADSWAKRRATVRRKFEKAEPYYRKLFPFERSRTKKLAILGFARPKSAMDFGRGIESQSIQELVCEIVKELKTRSPHREAVAENLPLLRAIQYSVYYTKSMNDD